MDLYRYNVVQGTFQMSCNYIINLSKQPGFEIVEVDGKRVRGKSQSVATQLLAEAFNNNQATMTFIVIPNY